MRGERVKVIVVRGAEAAQEMARAIGEAEGFPRAAVRASNGEPFPEAIAWLDGPRTDPPPPTVVFWTPPEPSRDRDGVFAVTVPNDTGGSEVMGREFYDGDD